MPEFVPPINDFPAWNDLGEIVQGYLEACMFCEFHSDNPELAEMAFSDFSPETIEQAKADCAAFEAAAGSFLPLDDLAQAGRDFWFTRNGHGVGFFDRRELSADQAEALDACARKHRELYVYAGDDGKVYLS